MDLQRVLLYVLGLLALLAVARPELRGFAIAVLAVVGFVGIRTKDDSDPIILGLNKKYIELGTPEYLWMEPDFIVLFYDLRAYRESNNDAVSQAILCADNVVRLVHDTEIGVKDGLGTYRVAEEQARKSINHVHSIFLGLPEKVNQSKVLEVIGRLRALFDRLLQEIRHNCNRKVLDLEMVNSGSQIVRIDSWRPFDPNDSPFDWY